MGFFRSLAESLPMVIFMGLVMDCFSGGAFGIFTTSYLWMYAVVIGTIQYLHVDSRFLMPVAIVIGVIWENIIILITIVIRNFELPFPTVFVKIVFEQILWAFITGPIVFFIIKNLHSMCEEYFKKLADRNLQSGDF